MKSRVLVSSGAEDWAHVPGNDDPAYLLTRGVSDPEKLITNGWFEGAESLVKNEDE